MTFPQTYPITNIYIFTDPTKASTTDTVLNKTQDKQTDADLSKENSVFKRYTRYLAFTKNFVKNSPKNKVLTDIKITNEKEKPGKNFDLISLTSDTREIALKKKQIYYRLGLRDENQVAISDIKIYSKIRPPLPGYTLIGDINGIFIHIKNSPIPMETQIFSHDKLPNKLIPKISSKKEPIPFPQKNEIYSSPLTHVSFQVNPKVERSTIPSKFVPSLEYMSLKEIENQFNYDFSLERSVLNMK